MEHDKTNRGAIWKNSKKEKDTHPDFTGSLNVNGIEYWVSAWKRKEDASATSPALSFSIKPKDEQQNKSISQRAVAKIKDPISTGHFRNSDLNDDIPY